MTRVLSKCLNEAKSFFRTQEKFLTRFGNRLDLIKNTSTASAPRDNPKLWVKSPYPDVDTVLGVEVHEMIFEQISKFGKLPAMTCGVSGESFTYEEIYRQARGFGAALLTASFRRGDVAGVVLPNIPQFPIVVLVLECWTNSYTEAEIKRQLNSSESKLAITIEHFLDAVKSAKRESKTLSSIIIIGEARQGCHTFSEMVKSDTTGVKYSSGANSDTRESFSFHTALERLDHLKIQNDVAPTKNFLDAGEQERLIGILPFFHSYGIAAIICCGLYQGAHSMSMPRFDPSTILKVIREHKPTCLHLVPPLINFIVNCDEYSRAELEPVHTIVGAAAPIGNVLIDRILEKVGRYVFFAEGYGMTELSPLSHILNPSSKHTKLGSCGRGVPSTWSKIIDTSSGKTVGPNTRGELLVKGPQVMKGYFRNEEATKNTIDPDGWLHTGDIAYYDDDGFFYIVDRLKELIKVKGFQVAPSELEDLLRKHEKVSDCAVIGIPNEESGEVPRAYIVPKDDNLKESDIHEYLKPLVATFKQLKGGVEFRKAIPKAPSGKILRRELADEYRKKASS